MAKPPAEPDQTGDAPTPYPGTPRWVRVLGIIALVVLLLVAFILVTGLGGPHGPQRRGAGTAGELALGAIDGR